MGLQHSKDSCQIFSEILQTVFSFQHGPSKHPCALICPNTPRAKRPVCVKLPEHAPCRFQLQSVLILTNFGSSVTQARVSNMPRARDPCIFDFSHTVRACQVTVRAIAFTYTFCAYMNLSHCWMNSTFKMIDSALGLFYESCR